jgi:hypothetical protein
VQLTGAETGLIVRQHGEVYRTAAIYGASPEIIEVARQNPIPQSRQSATGRAVMERRIVHIHDVLTIPNIHGWAERRQGFALSSTSQERGNRRMPGKRHSTLPADTLHP